MKNSGRPKLLILTSSFPSGQADETCGYIRDFVSSLAADFEITVLAPPDKNSDPCPQGSFALMRSFSLLPPQWNSFEASFDFNMLPARSLAARLAALPGLLMYFVAALALAVRADCVCSHWLAPSGLMGALISRLLKMPHVVIEHSGALHLLCRMRSGRLLARFIAGGSNRIITVSEDLRSKLINLAPGAQTKTEVLPMGVRLALPLPRKDGSPPATLANEHAAPGQRRVLFIARLTRIKGLDILLKAMQQVENALLIVAGDGDERTRYERMASELGVNARFLGRVGPRVREELLSACDAVVIPSLELEDGRTEGMPVVCLEAMASGKTVIASRVGGLREIIIEGHNGLLFNPGDSTLLAEKLSLALNDFRLRDRLCENARKTAAQFTWDELGGRFGAIIKGCISENQGQLVASGRESADQEA